MTSSVVVFWFRRDLRFDDNRGLFEAFKSNIPVLPVFIFDDQILNSLSDKADARVSFIYERLFLMNEQLKANGSSFYIYHGTPLNAFKNLCSSFNISQVFANHDYEPYAIKRESEISEFLKSKNVPFFTFKDQVIFEKSEVVKPDGKPYTIFTPYSKSWKAKYSLIKNESYASEDHVSKFVNANPFYFPTLSHIGFERTVLQLPPIAIDKEIIANYHNTRNIPSVKGTTKLSTHIRFGTVSIRKLATIAIQTNEQWLNELIWRDFFMMVLHHFPQVVTSSFKARYDAIKWRNNELEFEAWCKGETGYPIVDAGMRELNQTGFMHNRVRMIVASFLTKHLLIDWRWGEAYFAEKLLDYELSSNNGNWQWASGSGCDAAPYFRIFNPYEQTRRFDPDMTYIKKWLGDLNNYHLKPIVEHEYARKRALETFKRYLT